MSMGMFKKAIDSTVPDTKRIFYFTPASSAEKLDLNDYPYYTEIHCDTTSYTGVVTLPNVREAMGMEYTVRIHAGGTNAITVQDRDDSEGWTDITIEDADDRVTVRSNGVSWSLVESYEAD